MVGIAPPIFRIGDDPAEGLLVRVVQFGAAPCGGLVKLWRQRQQRSPRQVRLPDLDQIHRPTTRSVEVERAPMLLGIKFSDAVTDLNLGHASLAPLQRASG